MMCHAKVNKTPRSLLALGAGIYEIVLAADQMEEKKGSADLANLWMQLYASEN